MKPKHNQLHTEPNFSILMNIQYFIFPTTGRDFCQTTLTGHLQNDCRRLGIFCLLFFFCPWQFSLQAWAVYFQLHFLPILFNIYIHTMYILRLFVALISPRTFYQRQFSARHGIPLRRSLFWPCSRFWWNFALCISFSGVSNIWQSWCGSGSRIWIAQSGWWCSIWRRHLQGV